MGSNSTPPPPTEPTIPDPDPPAPNTSRPPPQLPYGIPVPGHPGLVKSPYSDNGYVDVTGFPPESPAKCPYTHQLFLVP
jgi:hypothetical protein